MKIDIRFQRACESERIKEDRKRKQELATRISSIIRSSPTSLAKAVYRYAHDHKMAILTKPTERELKP